MIVRAIAKNVGSSQKKCMVVSKIIQGMKVEYAIGVLTYTQKGVAKHFLKLLKSAVSNAVNNYNLNPKDLYIKSVRVDKGVSLKRIIFKGKGGISFFRRPYSHITIELSDENLSSVNYYDSKKNKNFTDSSVESNNASIGSEADNKNQNVANSIEKTEDNYPVSVKGGKSKNKTNDSSTISNRQKMVKRKSVDSK